MSWRTEHGDEFDVPSWFEQNMTDISWKNDVSPRFVLSRSKPGHEADDEHWINVWVQHPDEEKRELGGGRFLVDEWRGEDDEIAPILETDDLAKAVEAVRAAAKRLGLPVPPQLRGATPSGEVARALCEIQAHRRRTGQRPLDPKAAGWTDDDLLDEAERIRRLRNTGLLP